MIWDTLCKSLEILGNQTLIDMGKDARLFVIEGDATPELLKTVDPTDEELEQFFLPYPTVAVEDGVSCVLLADTEDKQVGSSTPRRYIECLPTTEEAVRNALRYEDVQSQTSEEHALKSFRELREYGLLSILSMGTIGIKNTYEAGKRQWASELRGTAMVAVFENGNIEQYPADSDLARSAGRAAVTCIEEIIYFNSAERFILESTPVKYSENKIAKKPKIARSHQRPIYTLLKPKEIRRRMNISEPTANKSHPRPHERRRHIRTLRSDRFRFAKGKTIIVPATWIGESESVIGKKRYRVVLDR